MRKKLPSDKCISSLGKARTRDATGGAPFGDVGRRSRGLSSSVAARDQEEYPVHVDRLKQQLGGVPRPKQPDYHEADLPGAHTQWDA